MTGPLAKTHVWHGGRVFFVSTINRESSAIGHDSTYAETMAWECDPETMTRHKSIIWQDEAPEGSIMAHTEVCRRLADTGIAEVPEVQP